MSRRSKKQTGLTCIKGDGGRLAALAIKRFWLFERGVRDPDFVEGLSLLWKERHGHPLKATRRSKPRTQRAAPPKGSKYCGTCEIALPLADFCKDKSKPDGQSIRCRRCSSEKQFELVRCICASCRSYCRGHLCRRCMTIRLRVAEIERGIAASFSAPIIKRQIEFEAFAKSIGEDHTILPSQRLRKLLAWKPGNLHN